VNPATLPAHIFREYDIRGRADSDLTDDVVRALGQAYGTRIHRRGGRRVAVGRDCRLSGTRLQAAFVAGVRAAGVHVTDIGEVPTPLLYFALHHLPVDGGVIITGSHNPPQWNGFKLCQGVKALYGAAIQDLRRIAEARDFTHGSGGLDAADVAGPWLAYCTRTLEPQRPLKVVVDAGNGMGGPLAVALYRALGFEVFDLFCTPDGTFPHHHPDPTVEANLADLKAKVLEVGADVGLAFDGDADRLGAVDGRGRVVAGDQILLLLAQDLLTRQPGARVIGEVKCSQVLYDGIAAAGGQPEMWKVGHSLIKARMAETGALLAGEMSGHLFLAERWFGYDDAVYAGARLLELLSRGASLEARLDALPVTVTTPEIRVSCPDEAKFAVAARAAAWFQARYPVVDIDGVRIGFPSGFGLLRPSNTQPVLVLRFEAATAEALAAYRGEVEAWILHHAPEVDLSASVDH
jgi:phosphomannomutase/phosphoglucomutase